MATLLEQSLLDLLPTLDLLPIDDTKNNAEQDVRLFQAAELLSNVEYELSPSEAELAKHFITCLVDNFISNHIIQQISHTASSSADRTSLLELGKRVNFQKVNEETYNDSFGFGESFRKLSLSPYIRPYLEYVLRMVWTNNYKEFARYIRIDTRYKKQPWIRLKNYRLKNFLLTVILFPLVLFLLLTMGIIRLLFMLRDVANRDKLFSKEKLLASFRVLLFMDVVSPEIWNTAYEARNSTTIRGSINIPDLLKILIISFRKAVGNGEQTQIKVEYGDLDLKYKFLGIMGEKSNETVDDLIKTLRSVGPAEGMRITNALVIAAQKNPYAVYQVINVLTNEEEFPEAIIDYDLIRDVIAPVSKSALITILDEVHQGAIERNINSRQGIARLLLSEIIDIEPAAEQYLNDVIFEDDFRKSVTVLKIFQRLYKLHNIDMSRKMIEYCTHLLNKPKYLFETIDETEFLEPMPRKLL
jgi:hypothetical protein